jgi:hypothetical protein
MRELAGIGGVLAAGLALAVLPILVFGLLLVPAVPDPAILDGDPCCSHPDTWGEVIRGGVSALAAVLVHSLVVTTALSLLGYAASGRRPTALALVCIPVLWMGLAIGGLALGFAAVLSV